MRAQVQKEGLIRWLDDVLEHLRIMDVKDYAEMATDRRHWRRCKEARIHAERRGKEEKEEEQQHAI